MSYLIKGEFLKEARDFFTALPEIAQQSASLAMNQVTEREGLAKMRRDMESQIAFPNGYLDSPDRLAVRQPATPNRLELIVSARDRPTSLARFAPGQSPENTRRGGVTVSVKKGRTKTLKKAFLVRLRNGNIGLATRDKSLVDRAYKPVMLDRGVYLLYGPSVDQVFKAVGEDALPWLGGKISNEFFRQFARLSRGRHG